MHPYVLEPDLRAGAYDLLDKADGKFNALHYILACTGPVNNFLVLTSYAFRCSCFKIVKS